MHTPAVYLRGAGIPADVWQRIEDAMRVQGWAITHNRTQAWHLARGGVPVVFCDFSLDQDATKGPYFGYDMKVTVGRVRARYGAEVVTTTVGNLLPTAEMVRLAREGAAWVETVVEIPQQVFDLPLTNGGTTDRPYRLNGEGNEIVDEFELVRLVQAALL